MMTYLEVREIDDYNKKVKKIIENGQVLLKKCKSVMILKQVNL